VTSAEDEVIKELLVDLRKLRTKKDEERGARLKLQEEHREKFTAEFKKQQSEVEFRQLQCSHEAGFFGQLCSDGVEHFVCKACLAAFTGSQLTHEQRPPADEVGGVAAVEPVDLVAYQAEMALVVDQWKRDVAYGQEQLVRYTEHLGLVTRLLDKEKL